ncbi:hypothetical protein [Streptomyces sp. NRRL S-118]|uniref:hypothetical protein n=1 Tax=Streptomyces sp. NRRL S-118 TaxID=1463881 RepID=UPI002D21E868|nr:hypothetical protein [Streptomyces sp. NRRL S-118]
MTGTNTTASLLATASLVGGPVALALAATGAVVLGTAAATRKHRQQTKPSSTRRSLRATAPRRGATRGGTPPGSAGRVVRQSRNGNADTTKAAARAGKAGGRPSHRGTAHRAATPSTLGKSSAFRDGRSGLARAAGLSQAAGTAGRGGRLGQVKALRDAQRKAAPSRATRRAETTGARRQVADSRRDAKQQTRTAGAAKKGPIGRAIASGLNKAGAMRRAAVDRARKARDQRTGGTVAQQRSAVRKAPARKRARKALWRSAARFQGRRILAALLAGALGLVGTVTTPLGRKLRWAWLQHPGRRLYRRLMKAAQDQRAARDQEIRDAQQDDETAADAEAADDGTEHIGDTAARPAGLVPAAPTTAPTSEGESVSGFRFEDHAAEMEAAASNYDPDGCMEILSMVEGLPAALTSVANVMKILAERSDSEFPLEKDVAGSFNDAFGAVMAAVAVAEDMGPLFRNVHAQDIARHEDPRNGHQAEKGWNV